ncbi:MerR family transcriptional regulator [Clostridiaceae bacterium M8S5]|nr:MerR family transcriptional regulator [Clostridiaceae bacterium M8S5]
MKISEVSKISGISISALRYYEKQNAIRNIKRDEQGLRDYSDDDLKWIAFLSAMKNSRLTLSEIMEYANLYYTKNEDFRERLAVTKRCREKLANELQELQESISFLDKKIAFYEKKIREQEDSIQK